MFLNLLFKSLKSDPELNRNKVISICHSVCGDTCTCICVGLHEAYPAVM